MKSAFIEQKCCQDQLPRNTLRNSSLAVLGGVHSMPSLHIRPAQLAYDGLCYIRMMQRFLVVHLGSSFHFHGL